MGKWLEIMLRSLIDLVSWWLSFGLAHYSVLQLSQGIFENPNEELDQIKNLLGQFTSLGFTVPDQNKSREHGS